MKTLIRAAVAAFVAGIFCATASANLIVNGSFEIVPNSDQGAGLLPSNWNAVRNPHPDTISDDATYGLTASANGAFNGVLAQNGHRWMAGVSDQSADFAQVLDTPMTPGQAYTLSAWLHRSEREGYSSNGSYLVYIESLSDSRRILGSFAPTTGEGWQYREFTFIAPSSAFDQPRLAFSPLGGSGGASYIGIDNLQLNAVPEPATWLTLAVTSMFLIRRAKRS